MKIQILRLESHDDWFSIREKLDWQQAGRVLLVFPPPRKRGIQFVSLERRLDLILLKRHAEKQGTEIAMVGIRGRFKEKALQVGIPVFNDTIQAQRMTWRIRSYTPPRIIIKKYKGISSSKNHKTRSELEEVRQQLHPHRHSYFQLPNGIDSKKAIGIFERSGIWLFFLGILFAAAILFIPHAEIRLKPQSRMTQELIIPIKASTAYESVDILGKIPARKRSIIIEGKAQIKTSSKIIIGARPAMGEVLFTNFTTETIDIPKGTRLSTLPTSSSKAIDFFTLHSLTLPASYLDEKKVFQSGSTLIQADLPGTQGNVSPDMIISLSSSYLGLKVKVTNPESAHSGTDETVAAVSSEDQERLYQILYHDLEQKASNKIQDDVSSPNQSLTDQKTKYYNGLVLTNQPNFVRVITKRFVPEQVNAPAALLVLYLKVEFQGVIVEGKDMLQLANSVLNMNLPPDYIAPLELIDTLKIASHTQPNFFPSESTTEESYYQWQMQASREIISQMPTEDAAQLVQGLSTANAIEKLTQQYGLESKPQINLIPSWWKWLPLLPQRITVIPMIE